MATSLTFFCILALAFSSSFGYRVGFGIQDVSPSDEEIATRRIFLGGYGFLGFRNGFPRQPAQGVHDPVWSRSMVIQDDNATIAITVVDSVGITNKLLDRMREEINAVTGIDGDNIMIGMTHTHCGPDLQGLWGGVTDSYLDFVVNGTVNSVLEAFETRREAEILVSGGTGYANNRRDWGYTDDEIVVFEVRDPITSERFGAFINFAAHPTALGSSVLEVSSDWPHYLREHLEQNLGVPVVFSNGAIGDVSPRKTLGGFEGAEEYGVGIASIALENMERQMIVSEGIKVFTERYRQQCTNPLFILGFRLGIIDYDYEGGPEEGWYFNTRTSYFTLGNEVEGVAFPGESLTRNAEPVKDVMTAPHKVFLGLNGDTLGYFVPSDEWRTGRNGNYEESISVDKWIGDNNRDILVDLIRSKKHH